MFKKLFEISVVSSLLTLSSCSSIPVSVEIIKDVEEVFKVAENIIEDIEEMENEGKGQNVPIPIQ